jgi:transposase
MRQAIAQLTKTNQTLTFQLKELKDKYYGRKKKKHEESSRRPRKKGAPVGHLGWYRKKPDHIDEIEVVIPEKCDECGSYELEATGIQDEEHIQEDIVLPKRTVKKFIKKVLRCKKCKSLIRSQGTDEIPGSYIGPRAKAWINTLRYEIGISQNKIKRMFETLFDMPFVQSSVVGFERKLRVNGSNLYDGIKGVIEKANSRYADETGWKQSGMLRHLWCFCTTEVAFFHIDPSRSGKVIAEILGKKFQGILLSDFYSAYNRVEGLKQKCIPHFLRLIIKQALRFGEDKRADAFLGKLKTLSKRIMEVFKHRKRIKDYLIVRADLVAQLKRCLSKPIGIKPLDDWRKQIGAHRDELTTCLFHPSSDSNNNFVERMLRQSVIMRKITFGNRSEKGIRNHSVIMSLLQTTKLNRRSPAKIFHDILVDPSKVSLTDLLLEDASREKRGPP